MLNNQVKNITKTVFRRILNERGIPEHDKKSNGGRIADDIRYGDWLHRRDNGAFEIAFNEWKKEMEK